MGEDEVATVRTLTAYREVMAALIRERRGRVVDATGDNLLAEFASVVDAVECAVELQREFRSRNAELPVPRRLLFRIGINLGDVIVEGERIYGDGVNIAARVEGLAEPGGIAISGTVYDQVKNKLALAYEPLGEHVVKNIREPVRVYRILSGLFVIARNSVFAYKGKALKPAQVSRELGVRYLLEGSVRKAGNRVRITAQLVDATTGYHVWAERYDRDLKDVFALQDEVTQKIVGVLAVKLTVPEKDRLGRAPTQNLEAYDDVLRGLEYHRRTTKEANAEARKMFARAVGLDPDYAMAYAALGFAHLQAWQVQWAPAPETLHTALALAAPSHAHDASLAGPHSLLGQVYLWKKEHERAIAEAERAVGLAPNDADSYETLAEVLAWSGRADAAIRYIKEAMRLDPQYPFFYRWTLANTDDLI